MRSYKHLLTAITMMLGALVLPASAALADGPLELVGTLGGAPYAIRVPPDWNGTLLVWVRGYSLTPTPPQAAHPAIEDALYNQGYALAGSSFHGAGWAIKEGIHDTLVLTEFFREQVGEPDRILLYGVSMGSVIVLKSMEKFPAHYDGALSMCSLGAGSTQHWDLRLDIALAYEVTLGWPDAWGTVGDVRDDVDFFAEVLPVYAAQMADPGNHGLFEFIRLVNHLPVEDFYTPVPGLPPAMFLHMLLLTQGRAELEARAGGPVTRNRDHVYSLAPEDVTYLETLGVNAGPLLDEMNARTDMDAERSARNYLEHYADFRGEINGPVVLLHTQVDALTPVAHTHAYMQTVTEAGNAALLARAYTNGVGHCVYTPEQMLAALDALDGWVDSGAPPDASAFPPGLGFLPDFEAPPWPQPPQ